jgi:hypothetical protein
MWDYQGEGREEGHRTTRTARRIPGGSVKAARPTSLEPVLDLARNLAEEFDTVPLPMVSRAVKSAVQATVLFGDNVAESLRTIERIAREDLIALRDTAAEQEALAEAG